THHVAALHCSFHQPQRFRFRFSLSRRTRLRTLSSPRQIPSAWLCAGRTYVRFCFIGSHRGLWSYSRVSCSGLRPCPRLPSVVSSPRFPTRVSQANPQAPPGYGPLTSPLMPVGYTSQRSVKELGFASIALLPPPLRLYPLPVRQASVLPSAS